MLSLTRKSDYALLALTHLARGQGQGRAVVASAREIAAQYRAPLGVMMNTLKALASHQMVTSVRGARGGYQLAMPAREISLRMVVLALEGPVRLFQCAVKDGKAEGNGCDQQTWCPILSPARKVNERFQQFLDEISLEELVEDRICVPGDQGASSGEYENVTSVS